ncbi:MAG: MurR/RpiR family transcriptional regulator [Lachnospiraceae bacterium]|nr:MurR/RpiR family transcriptional regulator [Lachnospiraceae bacterium]
MVESTLLFFIRREYAKLRKSEQKVADYILQNPDEVEQLSIAEVSRKAACSQPTTMRFVRAIGYESYTEFKRALMEERQEKRRKDKPEILYGYELKKTERIEGIPAKVISTTIKLLEDTLQNISVKSLKKAIKLLVEARDIVIYGVENSNSTACDLMTKLLYLGFQCKIYEDSYLQTISANNLREGDVAIGISYSGYSRTTVDVMKLAKRTGAATICITNFEDTLLSRYSDVCICASGEQFLYGNAIFSRTTQTAIVDMIYMGILLYDYDKYTKRLDRNSQIINDRAYKNN